MDEVFTHYSCDRLKQLCERIQDCLGKLTLEQVWARAGNHDNSIGNLVLHLCGNVRQWICAGVGEQPDIRDRDAEFAARGDIQPAELSHRLDVTLPDALAVIRDLNAARLGETIHVQKYTITVLEAVYHVVDHFAEHTGQIIFATKLLIDRDLGYYKHLSRASHEEATP